MNEMNIYVETETTPVIKKDITTPLVAAILMQKTNESSTKTEYYFMGADYIIKHDGKIDLPYDIMQFIRKSVKR